MSVIEWFSHQILSYKNTTNINGTQYILIPINKFEFLKMKAKEIEKLQTQKTRRKIISNCKVK